MNQPFDLDSLGPLVANAAERARLERIIADKGLQAVRQAIEDMPPHYRERLYVANIAAALGLPAQEGRTLPIERQADDGAEASNPPLGYSAVEVQEALRTCMASNPPKAPDYAQHPDAAALAHLFATMLSQNAQFVHVRALSDRLRTLLASLVHDGKPEPAPVARLAPAKHEWNRQHG
jgi:hypothetical protein